jgi:ABC-type proline/glycine betaine transport system permease subunit
VKPHAKQGTALRERIGGSFAKLVFSVLGACNVLALGSVMPRAADHSDWQWRDRLRLLPRCQAQHGRSQESACIFGVRGPLGALLNDWFGIRLVFTTAGASLACAVMTFPVMVRSVRLSLEAADPGLERAAGTLGARWLDRLFNVTLPLAHPRASWWA